MQLTRIRSSAREPRAALKRHTAAFAAAYSGATYGSNPSPAREETLTIAPPPRRRMAAIP
jgi:hypothetical protein